MPIYQLNHIDIGRSYLIWYIAESEKTLFNNFNPALAETDIYVNYRQYKKRLEQFTTRLAYKTLCHANNIPYSPILKDKNGRPYLVDEKVHISLSHCFPFAVAAISQGTPIGIDLQIPNYKLQAVQKAYLAKSEMEDSRQDLVKLCIYWCAKEAIYKAHGHKSLSFQSIYIEPFEKKQQGTIHAHVLSHYAYTVDYYLDLSYVLAWCQSR